MGQFKEAQKALCEMREKGPLGRAIEAMEIPQEAGEMFDLAGSSIDRLQSIAAQARDKGDWEQVFKAARELPLRSESRKDFMSFVRLKIEAIDEWSNDRILKVKHMLAC